MICENVLCTLRSSASSSGEGSTSSGSSSIWATRYGSVCDELAELARAGAPCTRMRSVPSGTLIMRATVAGHAHVVELVGAGLLDLGVARGDHHEHPVAAQHVVHELDRALLADRQRGERVGEGHGVLQRQHRQRRRAARRRRRAPGLAVVAGIWTIVGCSSAPAPPRSGPARAAPRAWRAGPRPAGCRPRRWRAPRRPTTSAPSSTTRRNGPCSISICW